MNDPIVDDVRRFRKEHAAQFGNDLNRIVDDLRKKEKESTHVQVSPGPKLLLRMRGDRLQ